MDTGALDQEVFRVVVPARYASTRLPGKPLVDLAGRPMILRVLEQARLAGAADVVVATDDDRVRAVVLEAGGDAELTRADHASGSDRVMEVVERRGWPDRSVVVNVQGDEPLIPPAVIRQVAQCLADHEDYGVATLSEPLGEVADVFDPNAVKVVSDRSGRALYFSRAPIPYSRDTFHPTAGSSTGVLPEAGRWHRHIGIYAFRVAALRRFVTMPVGSLERHESLEQLRLLEAGVPIRVVAALQPVPGGVDTPEDAERVRGLLSRAE